MVFYICVVCKEHPEKLYISPLKGLIQENCEVLTPGLPLDFAHLLLCNVQGQGSKGSPHLPFWRIFRGREKRDSQKEVSLREVSLKREILKFLEKEPGLASLTWQWESQEALGNTFHNGKPWQSIREDFLSKTEGRLLAKADLQRLAEECSLAYEQVLRLCQESVLQGRAEWLPAVKKEQGIWQCQRCGETKLEEWTSLYGQTATCPSCTALGPLSSLHALYRSKSSSGRNSLYSIYGSWTEPPKVEFKVEFSPRWEFSEAQKRAAHEVLEFVSQGNHSSYEGFSEEKVPRREILLWAACGAGKTEVCFPAAAWALEQGKKVLFAAPRQDVVLDVAPRLERDFPGLKTAVLTGVSPQRFATAPFVLATTHQILRFYQAFDLIFLDEMDAFPYYGNSALAWGVRQALKPEGKLVYLTATPSAESLEKVRKGKLEIIRLPARHHRRPVPVPEWRKVYGGLEPEDFSKNRKAQEVFSLIEALADQGPVLLFVPKISWVKQWVHILQRTFPQWQISGSYSADPQRREKIAGLRQKRFQAFVSTSILERGVTIPDAQVIVLEADHEVFDERALVQMAGRVGRTQSNPSGTAIFLAQRKTQEIERAIGWITEQNLIAKEQGLID